MNSDQAPLLGQATSAEARPICRPHVQVIAAVRVAFRAVSFAPVLMIAPPDVLTMRDGLQVRGPDAGGASAQMIKFETDGDRAKLPLPQPNMGVGIAALEPEPTIAAAVDCALPKPARRRLTNLGPETLFGNHDSMIAQVREEANP